MHTSLQRNLVTTSLNIENMETVLGIAVKEMENLITSSLFLDKILEIFNVCSWVYLYL